MEMGVKVLPPAFQVRHRTPYRTLLIQFCCSLLAKSVVIGLLPSNKLKWVQSRVTKMGQQYYGAYGPFLRKNL